MIKRCTIVGTALVSISALLLLNVAVAQVTTTDIVALSRDTAPDGLGKFVDSGFTAPVLNDAGQTMFFGATSIPFQGLTLGIFRGDGSALTRIVRHGEPAPAGNGGMYSFGTPALNNSGQAILPARIADAGPFIDSGIYGIGGGSVTQIVHQGQPAPNGNGSFPEFSTALRPALNNVGQAAFTVELVGTSGGASDRSAIFRSDAGALTQIARAGQAAPDLNGTFNFVGTPSLNDSGEAAFYAFLTGTSKSSGIFRGDGGELTTIARVGETAVDGRTFASFVGDVRPSMNENGQVAFTASLSGSAADNFRVFIGDGNTLTQVAREGQTTPNGSGTFTGFTNPVLNDAGEAAFIGFIGGTATANDAGIYIGNGSSLTQVARTGQTAPDGNGKFVFSNTKHPAFNNSGQAAFLAELTNTSGGTSDDLGLYFYDGTLGLQQIAREGDSLLGSTITSLAFANGAASFVLLGDGYDGLNDLGQVAYQFGLADGRFGVAISSVIDAMAGSPIAGIIGGGAAVAGGIDFVINSIQASNGLTVDYQVATTAELPSGEPFSVGNFFLQSIGDFFQIWDIDFDGTLSEPATLTFGYDPALDGSDFGIWHFDENEGWEYLGGVIDSEHRTITVQTDSFSPFVAAAAPVGTAVAPEPMSALVWGGLIAVGALSRRFRDATNDASPEGQDT